LHGGSVMLFGRSSTPEPVQQAEVPSTPPAQIKSPAPVTTQAISKDSVTIQEMLNLQQQNQPVYILDVRSDRSYQSSDLHAKGAIRVHPDDAVRRVNQLKSDKDAWLIAFCA
jgi:hypothetical protein